MARDDLLGGREAHGGIPPRSGLLIVIDNSMWITPRASSMVSDMPNKKRPGAPQTRMKEVALRAKVSAMSVSRALRSPDQVSSETLRRVQKAVRELGYVPNRLAGGLKAPSRTQLAAAIVPSLQNSLFAATIQGLTDALRKRGINLMLGDSGYSHDSEESLIAAFLAHRPCGLVLHDTTHTAGVRRLIRNAGLPVVETGNLISRPIDLLVSYSNFDAAKAMTEYLIGRSYRRIAFVGQIASQNERARERQRGYRAALAAAGLDSDETLTIETPGSFESGAKAIVQLMGVRPAVDAVFFAGDVLAIGAMLECNRRGWEIPKQIAIAGFDDWEISRRFAIPITTLDIPRYQIGEKAAELMLRRLDGERGKLPPIDVGFRIIERAST
ncbi:MAG: LacI family DNA-binding transcriptional regulator [Pseudolabrys sp.]